MLYSIEVSVLQAVLMNDRISAVITRAVLFFVYISPSGTSSSRRIEIVMMKKRSTRRICCTCAAQQEESTAARLCVLPLSDVMHNLKVASAFWTTSFFVTLQWNIPASSVCIFIVFDAYRRRTISSQTVLSCVTSTIEMTNVFLCRMRNDSSFNYLKAPCIRICNFFDVYIARLIQGVEC
jgi:hypothetical protein